MSAEKSTKGMTGITEPKVVPDECWWCEAELTTGEYIDVTWVRPEKEEEVLHRMCMNCAIENNVVEENVLNELKEWEEKA
jgi:hypothetical protein